MLNKLATSILILFTIVGTISAQSSLLPGKLAVYYGFPSAVNGAGGDLDVAAAVFSDYDIVIFGDSLQYPQYTGASGQNPYYGCDQNSHFDHDNTVGIISRLNSAGTAVYGYVSIGGENTAWHCDTDGDGDTEPAPYSIAEIESRVDAWVDMGVAGIFLDEAEYGFGCSRERQNETVDYVHSKGLPVFINAWNPDEVFGAEVVGKITYTAGSLAGQESTVEMNPSGAPTHLGSDDIYMMESFQIINGEYRPPVDWAIRSDKALSYKDQFGTRVATLTTPTPNQNFGQLEQVQLDYAWWSTLLYGFDYMGWGEANDYSSWGPYANQLYNRQRLDPGEIGSLFTLASVTHVGDLHTRTTTTGTIEVNSQTHMGRFIAHIGDTTPPVVAVTLSPNLLWPPNHKLIDIHATVTVSDDYDPNPSLVLTSIVSDELDDGLGDGDKPNDIQEANFGTPDLDFKLRAERSGKGDGRVYTVTYTATDASGNSASASATVSVPHSMKKGMRAAFPNPANPEVWLPYQIDSDSEVVIRIYDVTGRLVRTLSLGYRLAGFYDSKSKAAYWDGKNETGERVASGIYLYTLQAGNFTATRKLMIIR